MRKWERERISRNQPALPEGCLTYLEVLDDEYWTLTGQTPSPQDIALRADYRNTRNHPEAEILEGLPPGEKTDALREQARTKLEAEARYREGVFARAHSARRSALCFSGGGIRSATFGLGVLQALAAYSVQPAGKAPTLLNEFDYLSTVSGGGYLGSWFSAWAKRLENGPADVIGILATPPETIFEPEPKPVQHLRKYSSYLSPKLGLMSTDTWSLAATVLRNMFLNWIVLLPMVAAVLLIPLLFFQLARIPPGQVNSTTLSFLLLTGFAAGAIGTGYVGFDLPSTGNARFSQRSYLIFCLIPLTVSAIHLNAFWAWLPSNGTPGAWLHAVAAGKNNIALSHFLMFGALMHGGGMFAGAVLAWAATGRPPLKNGLKATAAAVFTGAIGGAIAFCLTYLFPPDGATGWIGNPQLYTCVAFPLVMGVFMLSGTLLVGLTSNITEDEDREWWARSGGWLLLPTLLWPVAASCVLYAGPWLARANHELAASLSMLGTGGLTAWLAFLPKTASRRSNSKDSSSVPDQRFRPADIASQAILPAFLLLLVLEISYGNAALLRWMVIYLPEFPGPVLWRETAPVWLMFALYCGICLPASAFINVNKFSLHAMYRLRLIRAYLGASNTQRKPNPFTGFDKRDNMPMHALTTSKPLHIVNMTLNLVKGENLAWQQRKAAPFTSTRLHTGSCRIGYRTSKEYGGHKGAITLGTAITVSGAAASPNMGYNSSPLLTIVMMLFNARLGWWLGNPRHKETWRNSGPTFGVRPFIDEMFGLTDDKNPWIYLSDGGHFENLGLYEAVLRRCSYIVVSDASCDPDFAYDDLGNAVRKIKIDLGISIDFTALSGGKGMSMSPTQKPTPDHNGRHCAIAFIRYSAIDGPGAPDGLLVYLKPSLSGDEPTDVRQYAAANHTFPHQTTADQFFEEAQFESYRRLGFHIIESICGSERKPRTLKEFAADAQRYAEHDCRTS